MVETEETTIFERGVNGMGVTYTTHGRAQEAFEAGLGWRVNNMVVGECRLQAGKFL